jgi:hypothetical protein
MTDHNLKQNLLDEILNEKKSKFDTKSGKKKKKVKNIITL